MGMSLGINRGMALNNSSTGQRFDFFVDSVNGDDANDGTTQLTAFQSLSALPTPYQGMRIALMAGSEWRETLDTSSVSGVTIQGYGSLATNGLPVIRGDDVVTDTWLTSVDRSDANTNVYSLAAQDFAFPIGQSGLPPNVYENDVIMTWASSLAACQATPGTFYHDATFSNVTGITVYIHPTGSTNPNSNGREYSLTTRTWACRVGNNSTIRLVEGINQAHDNGGINGGDDCVIDLCLAHGNILHPILTGSGVQKRSVVWVEKIDGRGAGGFLLEFFRVDGGKRGVWDRCMAIAPEGYVGSGFGGHTGAAFGDPNPDQYEFIGLYDCILYNCGLNFADIVEGVAERCYSHNGRFRFVTGNSTATVRITDLYSYKSLTAAVAGAIVDPGSLTQSGGGLATIDGLRAYCEGAWDGTALSGYNVDVTGSHIVYNPTDKTALIDFYRNSADVKRFTMNGTILESYGYPGSLFYRTSSAATELFDADDNVFMGYGRWQVGGTVYRTLAALQSGVTVDEASVYGNLETGTDQIGTSQSILGTGWTNNGDGTWSQDGTGSGATHRLQFLGSQAGVTATLRFTVSGVGSVDARDGGSNIQTALTAGDYEFTRTWGGAPALAPRGNACTISNVEWFVVGSTLPIRATDPATNDFTVIGDTTAGVKRHPDYPLIAQIPTSLQECRDWIIAQA
jgi:hypothetical protein